MKDCIDILRQFLAIESLWLDSTAVGKRIDPASSDPKAVASQARRERKIFAAWDGQCFHYLAFQFEPGGGPRAKTEQLVAVLPKERDGTVGLDAVLWVLWPDNAFGGKSPSEVFVLDPDQVIEEARIRRDGDRD